MGADMDFSERLGRIEATLEAQGRDIKELKNLHATLLEQSGLLREIATELKHTNSTLQDHDARIDALEDVPKHKFNELWKIIITALCTLVGSALIAYFGIGGKL